jgi:glycosyltransferase involved in cell wall biosynthesis
MWAMTGGCTNSMGCERWQSGCGNCPQWNGGLDVSSMLPLRRDSTAQIWRLKRYFFKHSNFAIIAISRWMRELAESSPMFLGKSVYLIPNCLDTNFWKPLDRDICKQVLEISPDKKVLLFVGKPQGVFAYPGRRTMLLKILAELKKQSPNLASQIVLLLVGDKGDEFVPEDYSVIAVQKVSSPAMLRICYNAADLLLSPTQFDNLPCTIQEALACGSPSIASHVGGIPDLVHHLETGFLASLESPREFAEGIYRLLTDCQLWQYVSNNARKMATEQFDDILIAKKIVEYYEYEIGKHRQI